MTVDSRDDCVLPRPVSEPLWKSASPPTVGEIVFGWAGSHSEAAWIPRRVATPLNEHGSFGILLPTNDVPIVHYYHMSQEGCSWRRPALDELEVVVDAIFPSGPKKRRHP